MQKKTILIGDEVRHKTKIINGNVPMVVSDIKNDIALCEHFQPDSEGGNTHNKTWFPIIELDKVIYGTSN